MKMAKGEAASMVTEAVLGEENLLSIVLKYSILYTRARARMWAQKIRFQDKIPRGRSHLRTQSA